MTQLSPEQQRDLDAAEVRLRVVDPRTDTTYVLVRADDYEIMLKWFDSFNRAGWDDPALDVYEEFQNGK